MKFVHISNDPLFIGTLITSIRMLLDWPLVSLPCFNDFRLEKEVCKLRVWPHFYLSAPPLVISSFCSHYIIQENWELKICSYVLYYIEIRRLGKIIYGRKNIEILEFCIVYCLHLVFEEKSLAGSVTMWGNVFTSHFPHFHGMVFSRAKCKLNT